MLRIAQNGLVHFKRDSVALQGVGEGKRGGNSRW